MRNFASRMIEGYREYEAGGARADGAVAYVREVPGAGGATRYLAKGFRSPRQLNDEFNYSFPTAERREAYIRSWFAGLDAAIARKAGIAARKKEARAKGHPFAAGTLLVNTWGYEQTNVDFWQVTEQKGDAVTLRRIGCATRDCVAWEQHKVTPARDAFLEDRPGNVLRKRVQYGRDGAPYIAAEFGCFRATADGQVHHETSYY